MKNEFSIVVVCKNEAAIVSRLLQAVAHLTNDIVLYDNGSTDDTVAIAAAFANVHVVHGSWEGFGKTKQKATACAKHDWVLSLDADEIPDTGLQNLLANLPLTDRNIAYLLPFKNFLGRQPLSWGEWGFDAHVRLFHRTAAAWNDAQVHEQLILQKTVTVKKLSGFVLHYTVKDLVEYSNKVRHYALLNAQKYADRGKHATWVKRWLAPGFTFLKFYIFMFGFLDGWAGLVCARMTAHYTFLKYARLHELNQNHFNQPPHA